MRPTLALLLASVLLLAAPAGVAGQDLALEEPAAPARKLTAGVRLGGALAVLGGDTTVEVLVPGADPPMVSLEPEHTTTRSLTAGVYGELRATEHLGLRVEALYSERGTSGSQFLPSDGSDPTGNGSSISFDYDMRYIAVPILATYTIPYDGSIHYQLFAGPNLGFLLSSELGGSGSLPGDNGEPQMVDDEYDLEDDTASVDLAATIGAGASFPLDYGRLTLDVRYTVGIPAAIDETEVSVITNLVTVRGEQLRHRVLSVMAGWQL